MKITILYVSVTGNTETAAEYIEQGIKKADRKAAGLEVKLMNLVKEETLDPDYVKESKTVIIGTPTYVANMSWQMKKWFDTNREFKLAGKLGGVFATANFAHGGADLALLGLINHMLVKGMLIYSSGSGCGKPFIHLGPMALKGELKHKKKLFMTFGRRMADKTLELFG